MNHRKFNPYIIFLALLTAIPASAIDMYLAAIPKISSEWNVPQAIVSTTISFFFISMSVGILIYGPLSDKYGRKPVLIFSMLTFTISSFLCSVATSIDQLVFLRIIQGLSASGPATMSMAISRDKFHGQERKKILIYVGMVMAIVPMVAPTVGAFILEHYQWQIIFRVIGFFSIVPLVLIFLMDETNLNKSNVSAHRILLRYKVVLTNKNYLKTCLVMMSPAGPFFAFIAFSSIAYINYFNQSEKVFGYLFAFNAACSILGGIIASKLIKRFEALTIINSLFAVTIIGTLLIVVVGSFHFALFALFMGAFTLANSAMRPLSNAIILEQVETDIGSATSIMLFYQFAIGSVYMSIVTMKWDNPILFFGLISFVTMVVLLLLWNKIKHQIKLQ